MKRSLRNTVMEQKSGKGAYTDSDGSFGLSPDSIGHSDDNRAADGIDDMLGRYSGKSERELMSELKALTARQKADGSFDPYSIQRGVEAITPMLNDEQKRRLNEILNKLA